MKRIDTLITELGLNEAIEAVLFSEENDQGRFLRRLLAGFNGKMPYQWLVVNRYDCTTWRHFLQPGVDYNLFNKKLKDMKDLGIPEEEK